MVINLRSNFHSLSEGKGAGWKDHELLKGHLVPSMGPPVDDVKSRNREGDSLNVAQLIDVTI